MSNSMMPSDQQYDRNRAVMLVEELFRLAKLHGQDLLKADQLAHVLKIQRPVMMAKSELLTFIDVLIKKAYRDMPDRYSPAIQKLVDKQNASEEERGN